MAPEVALCQLICNWEAIDSYGFGHIVHEVTATFSDVGSKGPDAAAPRIKEAALQAYEIIEQRLQERFAVAIAADVPSCLAAIARACLAIDPDSRPAMATLRCQLEAACAADAQAMASADVDSQKGVAEGGKYV